MKWLIACLGLVLLVAGTAAVGFGWDIVTLERGWTLVIAGSVAATGGIVTLALAVVAARVDALARQFVRLPDERLRPREDGGAEPVAERAPVARPVVVAPAAPVIVAPVDEPPPEPIEVAAVAPARRPRLPLLRPLAVEPEPPVAQPTVEPEPELPVISQAVEEGRRRPALPLRREPPVPRKPYRPQLPVDAAPQPAPSFRFADAAPRVAEPVAETSPESIETKPAVAHDTAPPPLAATPEPLVPSLSPAFQRAEWPGSPQWQVPVAELPRVEPAFVPAPEPAPAIEALNPPGRHDWLERALAGTDDPLEPAAEEPPAVHLEDPPHAEAPPLDPVEPIASADSALEIGRYESNGSQYVMFADGSIEADTPRGVYRFASMDDLKAFIDEES